MFAVEVADVDQGELLVHDAHARGPDHRVRAVAAHRRRSPDPRADRDLPPGERPTYDDLAREQIGTARAGTGSNRDALAGLLNSGDTWTVA